MRIVLLLLFLHSSFTSLANAISKEEFVKLPYEKRKIYAVVPGASSEYAIPIEEALKLPFEVRRASSREKARDRIQYAIANIGEKESEVDISQLYDLGMSNPIIDKERIINYGTIGGMYHGAAENNFKAAEYLYKDYLEWKKFELGQPSLWWPGGGSNPLGWIVSVYIESQMYNEWDALYVDYNEFHWKRQAGFACKGQGRPAPDCVSKWLKANPDYQDFLAEWKRVKKMAKTTKPKPLSPQVQHHEWFYSGKQEEVLKALEYYHTNKVQFMLEKALKHKDPVIAAKAKEYQDKFDLVETNEAKSK